MKIKYPLSILLLLPCLVISAQTTFEEVSANLNKAGGVYMAYPQTIGMQTPPPRGYRPFYISHYGRHGSRYLIDDNDYKWVLDILRDADCKEALTPLGKDVRQRLERVWTVVRGHGGDLSPVGVKQHRGIALRMLKSYPEVFSGSRSVSARSTVSLRCNMSMVAFGDELKGLSPKLKITYETGERYMDYLCYSSDSARRFADSDRGPWVEEYHKFRHEHTHPQRLISSLFSSQDFVRKHVDPGKLMWGLYWIAVDMQDIETSESFYDLFLPEELFSLWQVNNYRFYATNANHKSSQGIVMANAAHLLRNIITSADHAIKDRSQAATLRFGHDGNIIPLLALMHINSFDVSTDNPEEVYRLWSDFKASPMAANVQLIFFSNKVKEVIVKILHNEHEAYIPVQTDIAPYYKWVDVKAYYEDILCNTYQEK